MIVKNIRSLVSILGWKVVAKGLWTIFGPVKVAEGEMERKSHFALE